MSRHSFGDAQVVLTHESQLVRASGLRSLVRSRLLDYELWSSWIFLVVFRLVISGCKSISASLL